MERSESTEPSTTSDKPDFSDDQISYINRSLSWITLHGEAQDNTSLECEEGHVAPLMHIRRHVDAEVLITNDDQVHVINEPDKGTNVPAICFEPPSDESTPHSSRCAPDESPFFRNNPKSRSKVTKQFADSGISEDERKTTIALQRVKTAVLFSLWLLCTFALTMTDTETEDNHTHHISVPPNQTKSHYIQSQPNMHQISLELQGALGRNHHIKKSSRQMHIWIELIPSTVDRNSTSVDNLMSSYRKKITKTWVVPLVKESSVGIVTEIKLRQIFDLKKVEYGIETANSFMCLQFSHNLKEAYPVSITVDLSPIDTQEGVIYAAIVLVGLYALIIFEVIHRTLAAMLASTISLATMALLGEKTTQMEVITWIDIESLLLLFSMMVMVAIFSETGIFDYLAVIAYKWTNGKMWSLINILCIFTIIVSALLDSVTTVLLMTPVTIRLCEVMKLNPVPILMAMIMYSNIGGAVTPIGDPPNVIIATNPTIQEAGVSFFQFTMHMGLGLIFVMFCVYVQLRFFIFRNNKMLCFKEPQDIQELRHEIAIWRKTANSVSSCSKDEDVVRETMMMKIRRLGYELKRKLLSEGVSMKTYTANLEEITNKFKIKNQALLVKSTLILVFVITTFFMSSSSYFNLPIGGTAILGAMLLLMIADIDDIETILSKVEWSTLIFFSALFIVMEALSRLGLIRFIGHQTEEVILLIDKEWRLAAAIMLILWVSALASSFVDNIPLTTMMIRIVISLNQNEELKLPLQPLVWSLALGACLGGNGTLIGSSSNVVCAGVAEQHGYKFTFMEFSKIGFPVMVFSVVCATIYLMIAHVIIGWNY